MDQATDLPEGTELDLVIDDEGDELDADERRALNATISLGLDAGERGDTKSAEAVLEALRKRRRE